MNDFKSYLENESKSPKTIQAYIQDLKSYFTFTGSIELTKCNIKKYKQHLIDQNKSVTTINRHLTSLRQYNNYLISTSVLGTVLVSSNDFIKVQKNKTNPNNLTEKDINEFVKEVKKYEPYRNYAIVMTLLNSGLRIEECLSLRLNNINLNTGKGKVIGKGSKIRDFNISPNALEVLKEYIDNYRNEYKFAKTSPYIFVSTKGKRLNPTSINAIFNYRSDNKITPHMLRHYYATAVYQNTKDILLVKGQLGHSHLSTTEIYTHQSENDKKKMLDAVCIGC